MATYQRKRKTTASFSVTLDGEPFSVELSKLTITEILAVERAGRKIQDNIKSNGGDLTPEAHAELVELVRSLVREVHDLADEDGQEIKWRELNDNEQHDLLACVNVDGLIDLFKAAGQVGRLTAEEKKA